MKLKYIFMALAPMLLASCSEDDLLVDGTNGKITFATGISNNSRASVVATNANLQKFNVSARVNGTGALFFEKLDVTKTGSTWATDGDYYWGTAPLDFYSYSTSNKGVKGTGDYFGTVCPNLAYAWDTAAKSYKLTGVNTGTGSTDQYDLLIAKNTNVTPSNNAVTVNFKHAFARVTFKIRGTSKNCKYYIKQLYLAGYHRSGEFTFPTATTDDKATTSIATSQWKTTDELTTLYSPNYGKDNNDFTELSQFPFVFVGSTDKSKNTYPLLRSNTYTGEDVAEYFFIPQKFTAWDPETEKTINANKPTNTFIAVNCAIYQKSSASDATFATKLWPKNDALTANIFAPFGVEFKAGKHYDIICDITEGGFSSTGDDNLYKLKFEVNVVDFDESTNGTTKPTEVIM